MTKRREGGPAARGTPDDVPAETSLRQRVVASSGYVLLRRAGGAPFRLAALFAITAIVGPAEFGVFAGTAALVWGATSVTPAAVLVIRSNDDEAEDALQRAYAMSFIAAGVALLPTAVLAWVLGSVAGHPGPVLVIAVSGAVILVGHPARGALERELRFRRLTTVELIYDFIFYGVSLSLALAGLGVWALALGFASAHTFLTIAFIRSTSPPVRVPLDRSAMRQDLAFSGPFIAAHIPLALLQTVNPIVVGLAAGPAAVGVVALAIRVTRQASFLIEVVERVGVTSLARVRAERSRLARVHAEGSGLTVLFAGPPLVVAAWVAVHGLPIVLGDEWQDVGTVVTLLVAAELVLLPFHLDVQLLAVEGLNRWVAAQRAALMILIAALASLLAPDLGPAGYGWAALIASTTIWIVDRGLRTVIEPERRTPLFRAALLIVAAAGAAVAFPIGLVLLVPALLLLVWPTTIRTVVQLATTRAVAS